jgi:hypothetical protein
MKKLYLIIAIVIILFSALIAIIYMHNFDEKISEKNTNKISNESEIKTIGGEEMKIRTVGASTAISARMTKEEWEKIKTDGDAIFSENKIGYMQVAEGKIFFSAESPYFKDFKEVDININKEV